MSTSVVANAVQILRECPEPAVPLAWLRERLVENEAAPGMSAEYLTSCLERNPDTFMILESATSLAAGEWPAEVREAYAGALSGAGVHASPTVLLVGHESADATNGLATSPPGALAAALRASLAALCRNFADDPTARQALLDAVARAREVSRAVMEHRRGWWESGAGTLPPGR